MTSGFRREDLPPIAKTHGSSRIGPDWLAIRSVEAENMLPEVQIGGNYIFFSWIFTGFEQNPPDLSKKLLDFRWI